LVYEGFLCEICKGFWTEREDAEKCESSHDMIAYQPVHGIGDEFPLAIRAVKITKGKESQEAYYQMDDSGIQEVKEEEETKENEGEEE
jgi:hypothetical protein